MQVIVDSRNVITKHVLRLARVLGLRALQHGFVQGLCMQTSAYAQAVQPRCDLIGGHHNPI